MSSTTTIIAAAFSSELVDVLGAATWFMVGLGGLAMAVNKWQSDSFSRSMLAKLIERQARQDATDQRSPAKGGNRRLWSTVAGMAVDWLIFCASAWTLWRLSQSPAPATTGSVALCAALAGMMVVSSLRKW